MLADDPKNEDGIDTGPLHVDEIEEARTTALPAIPDEQKTNPVQRSMLTRMVLRDEDEDETEFLRQDEVDELEPTEELNAAHLVSSARALLDAETIETGEDHALRRGAAPAQLDDSDVVTLETDEEKALQRRKQPPPMTRPAVLLDASNDALDPDPPTQPQPAVRAPANANLRPPTRDRSAPFWKRDSFWRTGQPTQPAEVLRVPITDDEISERQAHAMKVALGSGFFGAVAALAIAMTTWMEPLRVLMISGALVLPMAAATAWLTRPEDLSQFRPEDLRLLARPVALGAAVLLLFALPWQFGFVRSMLRPFAGSSAAMSLQILLDRSTTVAIDECVRIAPNPQRVKALAAGLPGRVDVTKACFEQVTDQPEAAARDLLTEWRPLMVASTVDSELACNIVSSAAVLPLRKWELRSAYVDCVIEGAAEVQECCGEALVGLGVNEETKPPEGFVPDETAAGSWLQMSLGELTPRQKKIREAAGLDTRIAADASIDFACGALDNGAVLGPQFVTSLKSCGIGPQTTTDGAYWRQVCASMRQRLKAQQDRTKARALCDAAKAGGAPLGTQPGEEPSEP